MYSGTIFVAYKNSNNDAAHYNVFLTQVLHICTYQVCAKLIWIFIAAFIQLLF